MNAPTPVPPRPADAPVPPAYRDAFEAARPQLCGPGAARAAAFARFVELGFPGGREESWKYTSLRRLESRRFPTALREPSLALPRGFPVALGDRRIVLVNGFLHPDASDLGRLPAGVHVHTLASDDVVAGRLLRVLPGGGTERFTALNAALTGEPLLIRVDAGARPTEVLHLLVVASGPEPLMSHPRLALDLGPGSRLCVVVHHLDDGEVERFVNCVLDVEIDPDAELRLYRLQAQGARAFQIERCDVTLGGRARLELRDAQLGASLARLDLNVALAGRGAEADLSGLFLADGTRHLDTRLQVDHLAVETRSQQDYRGIAAGRGRAVFNGKAIVHPGAQKSQARQSSRNLLLTPGAEIDTKPELEIYADDVQCSHGATTGQLDPVALFYLRSRGLDEAEARRALTRAFAASVLSRFDLAPLAAQVHEALDSRLDRLLEAGS